jgi:VanZ family protein
MSANGLREKPRRTLRVVALIAAIVLAALIFYLSSIPGSGFPPHPEFTNSIAHFGIYLILAVLLTIALDNSKRALWKTALIALIITSLYGVSDELHQQFTGRNCDVFDWVVDTVGALVGVVGSIWVVSARKVKRSRIRDAEKRSR